MKNRQIFLATVLALITLCSMPQPAMAYVGPGAGLSAIGAFLAIIVGVIVALFGFVWYPFKRMMRKRKSSAETQADGNSE